MSQEILYNAADIFKLAFGFSAPAFAPDMEIKRTPESVFQGTPSREMPPSIVFTGVGSKSYTESARKGMFGYNVASPIMFLGGDYKRFDRYGDLQTQTMPDFHLPATTLVDFSRSKILPETPQSSGQGANIEMYSFENWKIRIRGVCLTDTAHPNAITAQEQKEAILQWEELASGIYVVGKVFSEKQINYMVIKSITISQVEGRPHAVPFDMDCISLPAPEDQIL